MANKTIALEASDASISTATISIKVVQVGKRQLTQSTFKQLDHMRIVDEEHISLAGVPWGHVRYFWGNQQERSPLAPPTHFLVQDGATLKRSLFWVRDIHDLGGTENLGGPLPVGYAKHARRLGNLLVAARYTEILEKTEGLGFVQGASDSSLSSFETNIDGVGVFRHSTRHDDDIECAVFAEHIKNTPKCLLGSCHQRWERDLAAQRSRIRELMRVEIAEVVGRNANRYGIQELIDSERVQMIYFRRRWNELMEKLRSVEQLFIAT